MTSKKLFALIELIKKHRHISSINELARLAEEEKICTRMTVFNLLPKIQEHEFVDFEIVNGQDTFTYVNAENRTYSMENELRHIDSLINELKIIPKDFKSLPKKLSKDRKLSIVSQTISAKRKIIIAQQRMIHFDACGYRTKKTKERFDQTKDMLYKIDLDIHKNVVRIDRETGGDVFNGILQYL